MLPLCQTCPTPGPLLVWFPLPGTLLAHRVCKAHLLICLYSCDLSEATLSKISNHTLHTYSPSSDIFFSLQLLPPYNRLNILLIYVVNISDIRTACFLWGCIPSHSSACPCSRKMWWISEWNWAWKLRLFCNWNFNFPLQASWCIELTE